MPVVSVAKHENDQLLLDPENYKRWVDRLRAEDIRGKDVFVLSIVGKAREGKSTLLNLAAQCLDAMAMDESVDALQNWCPRALPPDSRFETSNKTEGCTKGIDVEIEPWIIEDASKKRYAVFIMDSQGLSEIESGNNSETDSALFLLANLMSSVTVLNIFRGMDYGVFTLLASFAILANDFKDIMDIGSRNILRDLIVLIRDREFGNNAFGWECGQAALEKCYKQLENRTDGAEIPTILRSTYKNISCFLMAKPTNVEKVVGEGVTDVFVENVQLLMRSIFGQKFIRSFENNGKAMDCASFSNHVERVGGLFKDGKLPKGQDLLAVLRQTELENMRAAAFKCYENEMHLALKDKALTDEEFQTAHDKSVEKCKSEGIKNSIIMTVEDSTESQPMVQLDTDLKTSFERFRTLNAEKNDSQKQNETLELEKRARTMKNNEYETQIAEHDKKIKELEDKATNLISEDDKTDLQNKIEKIAQEKSAREEQHRKETEAFENKIKKMEEDQKNYDKESKKREQNIQNQINNADDDSDDDFCTIL